MIFSNIDLYSITLYHRKHAALTFLCNGIQALQRKDTSACN